MDDKQLSCLRHDLRGCLNAIRLSLEVLKMSADGTDPPEFLALIEAEVLKADAMLHGLATPAGAAPASASAPCPDHQHAVGPAQLAAPRARSTQPKAAFGVPPLPQPQPPPQTRCTWGSTARG